MCVCVGYQHKIMSSHIGSLQRDQQHQGLLLPQKMIEEQKKRMSEIAKMKDEQKTVEKRIELKQKEMEAVWKNEQKRLIQQDVEKTKHFKTFLHKMQLNDQAAPKEQVHVFITPIQGSVPRDTNKQVQVVVDDQGHESSTLSSPSANDNASTSQPNDTTTPLFPCPHGRCKYTAKLEYMLRRHVQKKHDRYACDQCRPHLCSICGRGFSRKDGLERHQIVHTKMRPFPCPEAGCEYKATQKSNLKVHLNRIHPNSEHLAKY